MVANSHLGPCSVETDSPAETRALAEALGAQARAGDRVALRGPLGAGKTQFAKGFARGVGVTDVVNSPSFTLMAEYAGSLPLFHIDLYRLDGPRDAWAGGMMDEREADGVTLIEWAGRLGEELLGDVLDVTLDVVGEERRRLTFRTARPEHLRYLQAAAAWRPEAAAAEVAG